MKPDKLTNDERDRFMELIHESLGIKTHFRLYLWLQGSLQKLLPHDVLIAAWGDFPRGRIYHDVISQLPGVRTGKMNNGHLTRFLNRLFVHWENNGRIPALLTIESCMSLNGEADRRLIAKNFGDMKSVLVHAIKDFRGRNDCLYVLLSREQAHAERACTMLEALLPHIDASLRKVPHLPEQLPQVSLNRDYAEAEVDCSGITPREAEIMRLVRVGKTNVEIGMILDISVFTVKNHLQNIFKKLNVNNRAQAVSKF